MSLDIKYRPNKWEDIVGQDDAVKSLRQQVLKKNISNAYLFTGWSGTGKTTLAYLFAKAVNCEYKDSKGNPCEKCIICTNFKFWFTNVDGATNRGIENMRKLQEEMYYKSYGKYKFIFIDEVASVTKQAFESILKSVEEPPKNMVWLFASVEQSRIPKTIQTRCQSYKLGCLTWTNIHDELKKISAAEEITITDESLWSLAKMSGNSMRQAIKNLEVFQATGEVKIQYLNDSFLDALGDHKKLWDVFRSWNKKNDSFEDFLNSIKRELVILLKIMLHLNTGLTPYALKKYEKYGDKDFTIYVTALKAIVETIEKTAGVYDYETLSFLTYLKIIGWIK